MRWLLLLILAGCAARPDPLLMPHWCEVQATPNEQKFAVWEKTGEPVVGYFMSCDAARQGQEI